MSLPADAEFRFILRSFRNQKFREMVVCIQLDVFVSCSLPIWLWSNARICQQLSLLTSEAAWLPVCSAVLLIGNYLLCRRSFWRRGDVSTEELRHVLRRYRSFFNRLLPI